MKRLFDIFFALLALAAAFPLMLLIALGIRLSSSGPILYRQPRLGRNGRIFSCLKFRTMRVDAERQLSQLLCSNPILRLEWIKNQKLSHDPRVFPLGSFLRRTSLDELPQFWNILKGDLSVVGPRPYLVAQKSELGPQSFKILSVRPGLTGLWQTSGRSGTTFRQRIDLDAAYVEAKSFSLDLRLILKTIPAIFSTKNAC